MTIHEIMDNIAKLGCGLVEVTGGEPLFQKNSLFLLRTLVKEGYTVLLETNGTISLSGVPHDVVTIMDIKTPGSLMYQKNRLENLKKLNHRDEVKFVVTNRDDYDWSKQIIADKALLKKTRVSISPAGNRNFIAKVASWMAADSLTARLNLQLHKIIWPGTARGV
jgi:7-carboxy-7-deazaguanine synthase